MKKRYLELTTDELRDEENELRTALFNLRLQNTTKELENSTKLRDTRRDLARVLTAIRQKEIAAEKEKATEGATNAT